MAGSGLFALGSIWVQNLPQLFRDSIVVFARNMSVGTERHLRVAVSELLLPQLHRHLEAVHECRVRVPECVQATSLDSERMEQWAQLSLHQQIRVPGCDVPRCEEKLAVVGPPPEQEAAQVQYQPRREREAADSARALRIENAAVPCVVYPIEAVAEPQPLRLLALTSASTARLASKNGGGTFLPSAARLGSSSPSLR